MFRIRQYWEARRLANFLKQVSVAAKIQGAVHVPWVGFRVTASENEAL